MSVKTYSELAKSLYDTHIITDPWLYGKERFYLKPIVLSHNEQKKIYRAAESIIRVYEELVELVQKNSRWISTYFGLTPFQKLMWNSSRGFWHGIARADVFILNDGSLKICEVNSDTPSGEAETVLLNNILKQKSLVDPNRKFEKTFCDAMVTMAGKKQIRNVAIIYPTELPEDLSMIRIYQQWFEKRGWRVTLGSPYNVSYTKGVFRVFNQEIDIVVRHYKTDWWSERKTVWRDQPPYQDSDALEVPLTAILQAEWEGNLCIMNPFGSVITQNKLTLAFMWEHLDKFSSRSQGFVRKYIPETYRLKKMVKKNPMKDDWVLKSDYGCEGSEVVVGKFVTDAEWKKALELAIEEHWVIQRFFEAKKMKREGESWTPNYGVYVIGGKACGIYTRLSYESTDCESLTAATFIRN